MNRNTIRTCAALMLMPMGIWACEDRTNPNNTNNTNTTPPKSTTAEPDNTARNARDKDANRPTPVDQKENSTDIGITADIRKAIMDDKSMSVNAQNVKIITASGVVTLRGVVDSQAEKDAIDAKAKGVAGVTSVTNELEVKPK